MNFTKKEQLFDKLRVGEWTHENGVTYYKGHDIFSNYFFGGQFHKSFEEFKTEFQENEIKPGADIYIKRLQSDLKEIILQIESYQEHKMSFFKNGFHPDELSIEEKVAKLEENWKQNFPLLESVIEGQLQMAYETLEYINESKILEKSKPEILQVAESNTTSVEKTIQGSRKVELTSRKICFKGPKKDLITLFYGLHLAGILDFKSRRDFEVFLEQNFQFQIGAGFKDAADIQVEMSKILNASKEEGDPIELKRLNEKKQRVFQRILREVEAIKLPPENGDDGWG